MSRPTLEEVRAWPAVVGIPEAAAALGISRSYGYELAQRGEFPCKVIRVGRQLRVVTASLLALMARTPSEAFHDEVADQIPRDLARELGRLARTGALAHAGTIPAMDPDGHLIVAAQLLDEATAAHRENPNANIWRHLALANAHVALVSAAVALGVRGEIGGEPDLDA